MSDPHLAPTLTNSKNGHRFIFAYFHRDETSFSIMSGPTAPMFPNIFIFSHLPGERKASFSAPKIPTGLPHVKARKPRCLSSGKPPSIEIILMFSMWAPEMIPFSDHSTFTIINFEYNRKTDQQSSTETCA